MKDRIYEQEFEQTAQRLEEVIRSVRSRLGVSEDAYQWSGLTREEPAGSARTQKLAEDMAAEVSKVDGRDGLLHLFLLRQLEIAMSLIGEMSARVQALEGASTHRSDFRQSA